MGGARGTKGKGGARPHATIADRRRAGERGGRSVHELHPDVALV